MTDPLIVHPFGEFVAAKEETNVVGHRYRFDFPNGYGASVVQGAYSYGGAEGLWELAVIDGVNGGVAYDTPITSDVLGHLEPFEVGRLLERIAKLPDVERVES